MIFIPNALGLNNRLGKQGLKEKEMYIKEILEDEQMIYGLSGKQLLKRKDMLSKMSYDEIHGIKCSTFERLQHILFDQINVTKHKDIIVLDRYFEKLTNKF